MQTFKQKCQDAIDEARPELKKLEESSTVNYILNSLSSFFFHSSTNSAKITEILNRTNMAIEDVDIPGYQTKKEPAQSCDLFQPGTA